MHQEFDCREEIVHQLRGVDLLLQVLALVVIAGVSADGAQSIRRQGNKTGLGNPARNVFDIGIEATVFVNDNHRRHFSRRLRRAHEVSAHLSVALRRCVGDVLRDDIGIGEFDLLRKSVIGAHRGQDRRSGQSSNREFRGAIEKLAFRDAAMGIIVIELKQLRMKVFRAQTFHFPHLIKS